MTESAAVGFPGLIETLPCSVDDVGEWDQKNRVKLYPERWNRWLLVRSRRDDLERADVKQRTLNALRRWFSNVPSGDGSEIPIPSPFSGAGKIDNVTFGPITNGGRVAALAALKKFGWKEVEWFEQKDPFPSLEGMRNGQEPWWVPIQFFYEGARTEIPWPTTGYLLGRDCPTNALWMLASSFAPPAVAEKARPAPTTFWGGVRDELPELPSAPSLTTTLLIAGLAGFGAWAIYKGATR